MLIFFYSISVIIFQYSLYSDTNIKLFGAFLKESASLQKLKNKAIFQATHLKYGKLTNQSLIVETMNITDILTNKNSFVYILLRKV